MNLIDNYIYFYHLEEYSLLPLYPESVADTMATNFRETNALSRSAPVYTFVNSGPRDVTLNFSLHRDLMDQYMQSRYNIGQTGSYFGNGDRRDQALQWLATWEQGGNFYGTDYEAHGYIDRLIRLLQSSAVPNYTAYAKGSKLVTPPMVAVRLGSTVFIKGVIASNISVTWKPPIMANGKYACADIQFQVHEVDPYTARQVSEQGSFRATTAGSGRIW